MNKFILNYIYPKNNIKCLIKEKERKKGKRILVDRVHTIQREKVSKLLEGFIQHKARASTKTCSLYHADGLAPAGSMSRPTQVRLDFSNHQTEWIPSVTLRKESLSNGSWTTPLVARALKAQLIQKWTCTTLAFRRHTAVSSRLIRKFINRLI